MWQTMERSLRRWVSVGLLAVAVSALTVIVYRPASNGQFVWDDDRYVANNHLLTAPDGLRRIWFSLDAPSQYFPLAYTVLRIERTLWGLDPVGYHWVNIFLHLGNALLVWCVLARLKVPGAWLAGAIFAVHPVQVESVAWISELKNVLMGFFFLLTLLAWIEYVDATTRRRRILYLAALLSYLLALSAKSTACTLPAALLLILWLKHKPIGRKALLEIVPFVVLALGIGLVAIWWEKYHQGTRVLISLAPMDRLLIASRAIWFYLSKIFWPSNLTFIYRSGRLCCDDLLRPAFFRPGRRSCSVVFCSNARPASRLHHALHISLHVRGGSLPVFSQHRSDRRRIRGPRDIEPIEQDLAVARSQQRFGDIDLPQSADLATKRDLSRLGNAVADNDREKPELLDGP